MADSFIDVSNDAFLARMAIAEASGLIREAMTRSSVLYRPTLTADGDKWCALLGPDLQVGVAGFGDTPDEAMAAFNVAFATQKTPEATTRSAPAAGAGLAGVSMLPREIADRIDREERDLVAAVRNADDESGPGLMPGDVEGAFHRVRDAVRALLKPPAEVARLISNLAASGMALGLVSERGDEATRVQFEAARKVDIEALHAAYAALARGAHGGSAGVARWRHVTRGTVYEEVGRAELQVSSPPVLETDVLVIYRAEDGKLWAREESEFEDGRFARIEAEDRARPASGATGEGSPDV